MVIVENSREDGEDNEEGAHACLNYNKNHLMKRLMCCTDKCVKQEIQISSIKKRCLLLDEKSKEDKEGQKGSFQTHEVRKCGTTMEIDADNSMEQKTSNDNEEKFVDWKQKYYDMCAERDICYHKHTELQKTYESET